MLSTLFTLTALAAAASAAVTGRGTYESPFVLGVNGDKFDEKVPTFASMGIREQNYRRSVYFTVPASVGKGKFVVAWRTGGGGPACRSDGYLTIGKDSTDPVGGDWHKDDWTQGFEVDKIYSVYFDAYRCSNFLVKDVTISYSIQVIDADNGVGSWKNPYSFRSAQDQLATKVPGFESDGITTQNYKRSLYFTVPDDIGDGILSIHWSTAGGGPSCRTDAYLTKGRDSTTPVSGDWSKEDYETPYVAGTTYSLWFDAYRCGSSFADVVISYSISLKDVDSAKGSPSNPFVLTFKNGLIGEKTPAYRLPRNAFGEHDQRSYYFKVADASKSGTVAVSWSTNGGGGTCRTEGTLQRWQDGKNIKVKLDSDDYQRYDGLYLPDPAATYSLLFETRLATCDSDEPDIQVGYTVAVLKKKPEAGADILTSNPDSMTCSRCSVVMSGLKAYLTADYKGLSDMLVGAISSGASGSSYNVKAARGMIDELLPTIRYLWENYSFFESRKGWSDMNVACSYVAALCRKAPIFSAGIKIPRQLKPPRPDVPQTFNNKDHSKLLTVLHLSDFHLDPEYAPGSEANCDYPMCCRKSTNTVALGKKSSKASTWGEYKCDTSPKLANSMMAYIQKNFGKKIDFSIVTGDMTPHVVWDTSLDDNKVAIKDSYDIISNYIKKPLFPAIGNHEASPVNIMPAYGQKTRPGDSARPLYKFLASEWTKYLGKEAAQSFVEDEGSYSVKAVGNLRVISLNTNACYTNNFYNLVEHEDVDKGGHLTFLQNELAAAEAADEYVWIISHIAPGDTTCLNSWSDAYSEIIERYQNTVVGTFQGHTHRDEFQVYYANGNNKKKPTAFGLLAPGVTPFEDGNPAFRIYDVDPETYQVVNSYTYIADLNQADEWDRTGKSPNWHLEYSARDYMPEWPQNKALTPEFWNGLVRRLEKDDDTWQLYFKYRGRSANIDQESCDLDSKCRSNLICDIRAGDSYFSCSRPDIFKRRLDSIQLAEKLNTTEHHYQRELCDHHFGVHGSLRGHIH